MNALANSQQKIALNALQLMDLTTLNNDDTNESVIHLCQLAQSSFGNVAAVCIYPQFVAVAKQQLAAQGASKIKVATVVNFPDGCDVLDDVLLQTQQAISDGADEIDLVLPYRALMAGDEQAGYEMVKQCKKLCGEQVLLKVIIESGVLKTPALIKKASEIAIDAGADFIKTSTGKVSVNATLEAAEIMLKTIKEKGVWDHVGFKAAGGVRTTEEAAQYLTLAENILGTEWLNARHFRFGASSLLSDLLSVLSGDTANKVDDSAY